MCVYFVALVDSLHPLNNILANDQQIKYIHISEIILVKLTHIGNGCQSVQMNPTLLHI